MIAELKDLLVIPYGVFVESEQNLLKIRTNIWKVKDSLKESKPWELTEMIDAMEKADKLIERILEVWKT